MKFIFNEWETILNDLCEYEIWGALIHHDRSTPIEWRPTLQFGNYRFSLSDVAIASTSWGRLCKDITAGRNPFPRLAVNQWAQKIVDPEDDMCVYGSMW